MNVLCCVRLPKNISSKYVWVALLQRLFTDIYWSILFCRSEIYTIKQSLHASEDREAEKSVELARLRSDLSHWKLQVTKYAQQLQSSNAALKKAQNDMDVSMALTFMSDS